MRTALVVLAWLGISALVGGGCRSNGSMVSGSMYCDAKSGSSQIPRTSLPTGTCKGSSTCIAFTAGTPCASASQPAGECQWSCTCVEDAWDCTASCSGSMCTAPLDAAPTDDASTTD